MFGSGEIWCDGAGSTSWSYSNLWCDGGCGGGGIAAILTLTENQDDKIKAYTNGYHWSMWGGDGATVRGLIVSGDFIKQ